MTDRKPLLIVTEPARPAAVTLVGDTYQVASYQDVSEDMLANRYVLYWPDAGESGIKKRTLKYAQHALQLKRISTLGQPKGWNATHAIKDGWTFDALKSWAREHVEIIPSIPELADEAPPTQSQYAAIEKLGLAVGDKNKPICNAANVVRFLRGEPAYADHVWFDEFTRCVYTDMDGLVREWSDDKTVSTMIYLQDTLGMHRITANMVGDAITFYAHSKRRHQVRDWLNGLQWDGEDRIMEFFSTYLGAEASGSVRAFGKNFWILLVKRIMHPGCQADYMVVLEGSQGIGKTRALQVIGGKWYAEVGISADSEDFERQLQGKILVEIAELHAFSKSDQSRIKQIITKRVDRYREKYGKIALDHPRQGILAGTTNESEWIKDQTGGRRFWPVRCGAIDLEALKRDRDQLFAEALARLKEGDEGYLVPEEETKQLQDERRETHPWEALLETELGGRSSVTREEAMALLKVPTERMNSVNSKLVAHILRRLGFSTKLSKISGEVKRLWYRNGHEPSVTVI